MQFNVYPLKGVNDIEFGMTADLVGQRMNGRLEIGDIRATSIDHPTYFYPDEWAFFYFDDEGHLDSIEFASGADILLGGFNPLAMTWGQAKALMAKLDPETIVDSEAAESRQLSMAIWCPEAVEGDHAPVESFLIGRPGYYDDNSSPSSD